MDIPGSMSFPERGRWVSLVPGTFQGMGMSKGWIPIPLLLTPSGDQHMYIWQVGATHPIGMLSSCSLHCKFALAQAESANIAS